MKFTHIFYLLAFGALFGCQDVIDLDLQEGEKRIIINGRVTDSLPAEVNIYVTTGYLSEDPNPTVSSAEVYLYENGIQVAQLLEHPTIKGLYVDNFTGTEGNSYSIEVVVPDGAPYFPKTRWISSAETMSRVFTPDSIYAIYEPDQPFLDEGYYAYIMFTEPAGRGDNYRFKVWKNDSLFDSQYDLANFNDDFADGRSFNNQDLPAQFINHTLEIGDTIRVEYSSISPEGGKFLSLLSEQTTQVGSTFDPPPAPIFGNIVNADDPSILGLGYFFASKLSTAQVIVQ